MREYACHTCGGMCDPGELENGVCFDCRAAAAERTEKHNFDVRKSINQILRERIVQQRDGQMAMRV